MLFFGCLKEEKCHRSYANKKCSVTDGLKWLQLYPDGEGSLSLGCSICMASEADKDGIPALSFCRGTYKVGKYFTCRTLEEHNSCKYHVRAAEKLKTSAGVPNVPVQHGSIIAEQPSRPEQPSRLSGSAINAEPAVAAIAPQEDARMESPGESGAPKARASAQNRASAETPGKMQMGHAKRSLFHTMRNHVLPVYQSLREGWSAPHCQASMALSRAQGADMLDSHDGDDFFRRVAALVEATAKQRLQQSLAASEYVALSCDEKGRHLVVMATYAAAPSFDVKTSVLCYRALSGLEASEGPASI